MKASKWLVKTSSYQGESEHFFDSEKEAWNKYYEWAAWDGNCQSVTSKPVLVSEEPSCKSLDVSINN